MRATFADALAAAVEGRAIVDESDLPITPEPSDPDGGEPEPEPADPGTTEPDTTLPPDPVDGTVDELLQQAVDAFAEADEALRAGDLAEYEALVERAERLVDQALSQTLGDRPPEPETTTTTTEVVATDA
jgi:hypothetical protein